MESIEALLAFFGKYLDYPLFSIIILFGVFITQYGKDILPKIGDRYKVLMVSIFLSVVFFLIEGGGRLTLTRYIFTYLAATSFYEIIGHWIILLVKRKFNDEDSEKKPNFDVMGDDTGGELPPSKPPKQP